MAAYLDFKRKCGELVVNLMEPVNGQIPDFDQYVANGWRKAGIPPSEWGNPFFTLNKQNQLPPAVALEKFKTLFFSSPWMLHRIHELEGLKLACHCPQEAPCHAKFLAEMAIRKGEERRWRMVNEQRVQQGLAPLKKPNWPWRKEEEEHQDQKVGGYWQVNAAAAEYKKRKELEQQAAAVQKVEGMDPPHVSSGNITPEEASSCSLDQSAFLKAPKRCAAVSKHPAARRQLSYSHDVATSTDELPSFQKVCGFTGDVCPPPPAKQKKVQHLPAQPQQPAQQPAQCPQTLIPEDARVPTPPLLKKKFEVHLQQAAEMAQQLRDPVPKTLPTPAQRPGTKVPPQKVQVEAEPEIYVSPRKYLYPPPSIYPEFEDVSEVESEEEEEEEEKMEQDGESFNSQVSPIDSEKLFCSPELKKSKVQKKVSKTPSSDEKNFEGLTQMSPSLLNPPKSTQQSKPKSKPKPKPKSTSLTQQQQQQQPKPKAKPAVKPKAKVKMTAPLEKIKPVLKVAPQQPENDLEDVSTSSDDDY